MGLCSAVLSLCRWQRNVNAKMFFLGYIALFSLGASTKLLCTSSLKNHSYSSFYTPLQTFSRLSVENVSSIEVNGRCDR